MKSKKSVIILTLLNALSAGLGLLYSIIQVYLFGVSRDIEIFFASSSVIYLLTSLTQSGQLGEVFLPLYHKLKTGYGPISGFKAFSVVLNWMIIFTGGLCILTFITAPFLINIMIPGFSEEDQLLAVQLFRLFVLFFLLEILNSFFNTLLNAEKIFGKTEFTNSINTLFSILFLLLYYKELGIWSLAIGLVLGKVIQFLMTLFFLPKIHFQYFFIFSYQNFNHKDFFMVVKNTFLYVLATQFYNIVLTASISFLPQGVYAVFRYVQNLFNKVRGIFISPINTVFYTEFSSSINKEEQDKLELIVTKTLNYSLFILFSVLIFVITLGDKALYLLWGNKKFNLEFLNLAYEFLIWNFSSLIFIGVGSIYRRISMVFGYAKQIYFYYAIVQIASAGISWILIYFFGVSGLKAVIVINVFLFHVTSFLMVFLKNKKLCFAFELKQLFKLSFFALLVTIFGIFIQNYNWLELNSFSEKEIVFVNGTLNSILIFSAYIIVAYLFKIKEITKTASIIALKTGIKKI